MTFAQHVEKSVSDPRVLVELDIGFRNIQWVNIGAGIWCVDAENIYAWVDSTLLDGFTAQDFGYIGSVQRDGILLDEVTTLAALTNATDSWYYDPAARRLYVCLDSYDEPSIHRLIVGIIHGYSYHEFTPPGAPVPYQGRLAGSLKVSVARDPLYYGRLRFGGGGISLINADGEFDTLQQDSELYGNPARIFLGYDDLDYTDYEQIFEGVIETFSVDWDSAQFTIADKRKSLSINAQPVYAATNPGTLIRTLLVDYYDEIDYTTVFFDTPVWVRAAADAAAYTCAFDASITNNENNNKPLIDYIGSICGASFLIFWITPAGKFTLRYIDYEATTSSVIIRRSDILNKYQVVYDPSEVVSSVYVGYAPTWTSTGTVFTWVRNNDYESTVYDLYKIYKEVKLETPLSGTTAAAAFASMFMLANHKVKGRATIEVPMKYYTTEIGEPVFVELERPNGSFIGTTLCTIMSVDWILGPHFSRLQYGVRFL